jgi:outer membrane biosynthesis protein TonB
MKAVFLSLLILVQLLGVSGWGKPPVAPVSELNKYKEYVRETVGSCWYPEMNKYGYLFGKGAVDIQFTIHSDGKLSDIKIRNGENLKGLARVSENALINLAPFKAFSLGLMKEVGDHYTDDFTFSIVQ